MEERKWRSFTEDPEREEIHLAHKKIKGPIGFLFSRTLIIVAMIALQGVIIVASILWFEDYFPHYALAMMAFFIVMILYLFNCPMDFSAKLTWIAVIGVVPLLGTLFLLFTIGDAGHRKISPIYKLIGGVMKIVAPLM